jgi:hypothetical protein
VTLPKGAYYPLAGALTSPIFRIPTASFDHSGKISMEQAYKYKREKL